MSKYQKLWEYVANFNLNEIKLSYEEIKNILGFEIEHSFLTYKKELLSFGYVVKKISLKDKTVLFIKC